MADLIHLASGLRLDADYIGSATLGVLGKKGSGKRLALDTPLPTPSGWTTMGEVRPGDELFDELGRICRVVAVHDVTIGDAYRVRFSDGSSLIADAEHLWFTWSYRARRAASLRATLGRSEAVNEEWAATRPQSSRRCLPSVLSTSEIAATLRHDGSGALNHAIRNTLELELAEHDLPVDPYVLGVWLGDGTRGTSQISTVDTEIVEGVRARGYRCRRVPSSACAYCILGLRPALRDLGVLRDKHVPTAYLRASANQRLALLQGLMDTDGGWTGSQAEIALSDKRLADDVYELIVSLGMHASCTSRVPTCQGKSGRRSYRARFSPVSQVFRLPRKAARHTASNVRRTRRYITAVTKSADVPMRCIEVDSSSRLYLAGRQMVPTHNSFATRVLAEEFWRTQVPFVLFDPMGTNWGLRSSADGQSGGIPVPIFGGKQGDAPLERTAGRVMAELAVAGHSMILDISELGSHAAEREFVYDFFEYLYRHNEDLIHVLLDESDLYAPQKPGADTGRISPAKLLGLINNIVRRGRNKAIAITLITQRSAVLNKDVLTQVDGIIVLRTLGPQDQKAIREWFVDHATPDQIHKVMSSLSGLANGEAWVWIPELHVFKRVQIRMASTFDSSPTRGRKQRVQKPKGYTDIDLADISDKIAATVERVKQDDPVELRKQIARLRRELEHRPVEREVETVTETVEVSVLRESDLEDLSEIVEELSGVAGRVVAATNGIVGAIGKARQRPVAPVQRSAVSASRTAPVLPRREVASSDVVLKAGARRMLSALASLHPAWLTRAQVGTLAKVKHTGGTFSAYLSALRTAGVVEERGQELRITEAGFKALGSEAPAPATPDELLAMWRDKLKLGARSMLDALVAAYPNMLSREDLAEAAGIEVSGGTFSAYLSMLRRTGLIEEEGREVRAAETLFLGVDADGMEF